MKKKIFLTILIVLAIVILSNWIYLSNIYYILNSNYFKIEYMFNGPLNKNTYYVAINILFLYIFTFYKHKKYIDNLFFHYAFIIYFILTVSINILYLYTYPVQLIDLGFFNALFFTIKNNLHYFILNLCMLIAIIFNIKKILQDSRNDKKKYNYNKFYNHQKMIVIAIMIIIYITTFIYISSNLITSNESIYRFIYIFLMALFSSMIFIPFFQLNKMTIIISIYSISIYISSIVANLVYSLLSKTVISFSPIYLWRLIFNDNYHMNTFNIKISIIFSAIFLFTFFILLIVKLQFKNNNMHGNARFAKYFDLQSWKMFKNLEGSIPLGTFNGKRVYSSGFEPVATFAPPGGGKSTSLVIPTILEWTGSTVINDMSYELAEITYNYLKNIKQSEVYIWRPMSSRTHRFNVFHNACNLKIEERWSIIERISLQIIPEEKGNSSSWSKMARRVIQSLSAYLIAKTGYCTLGQLAEICCQNDFDKWLEDESKKSEADPQFLMNATAFLNIQAKETRSGVKFNYEAYLGLYLNPIVRAATEYSDFDISELRKRKMDIFIGIADKDTEILAPLVTMFWEEVSCAMTTSLPDLNVEPEPVTFIIDEMGNMGKVDQIRRNLNILRKYRVRPLLFFQYRTQAQQYYSREEFDSFMNIKTKIIFTQANYDDANYFSTLFGQTTHKYTTKQRQAGKAYSSSSSEQIQKIPLVSADQLMNLDEKKSYISISGKYPIQLKKEYYFKNKSWINELGGRIKIDDIDLPIHNSIMPKIQNSVDENNDMRESAKYKRRDKNFDEDD